MRKYRNSEPSFIINGFSFKPLIDEGSVSSRVSMTRLRARNQYIHNNVWSSRNLQRQLLDNDLNQGFSRGDADRLNPSTIIRIRWNDLIRNSKAMFPSV